LHEVIKDGDDDLSSFTIDVLTNLQNEWQGYALLKIQAARFNWDNNFTDSDKFPFPLWVSVVVENGEPDLAMNASYWTEDYLLKTMTLQEYLTKMLRVAILFSLDCPMEFIELNHSIIKSLRFAVSCGPREEEVGS
jgi:hypothetical protein